MSDKTPAGAADNDGDPQESVDPTAEEIPGETASEADVTQDGESGPAIVRRTAAAPKRRKKTTAEADDEKIAALEENFTAEEQATIDGIRRRTAKAPVKKQTATRTRESARGGSDEFDPYAARNPIAFSKQSAGELKKVVWPTGRELRTYFIAVLVFVLFMITYVGLLDLLFGWGLLNLLGD